MTPLALALPTFNGALERLTTLVDIAQQHAQQRGLGDENFLHARLAPDMLPWHSQVAVACNFTLRVCYPLAGQPIPAYGDFPATPNGLRTRLLRAQRSLADLESATNACGFDDLVEAEAGNMRLQLSASRFLMEFGMPNFQFHFAMAYAILRQQGVPVGKRDFDGLHNYPPVRT